MKAKRSLFLFTLLFISLVFSGCPKPKPSPTPSPPTPSPPPQELLDEIAAAKAVFQEVSALHPPAEEVKVYQDHLAAAEQAMADHDYPRALDQARRARLQAERIYARMVYRDLEKLNPPPELTYHYRRNMQVSEEAEAAGDLPRAIQAAQEARRQANLALEYLKQCVGKAKEELSGIKQDLEIIYRPDFELIQKYWDLVDLVATNDCGKLAPQVAELRTQVTQAKERANSRWTDKEKVFTVSAPPGFVQQYGDPIMYAEVAADGRLQNRVNRVPVGTVVRFIRSMLFSRTKTFYFVQDTRTGIQGWMAERFVWPERAAQTEGGR